jgi:hypothetical protein
LLLINVHGMPTRNITAQALRTRIAIPPQAHSSRFCGSIDLQDVKEHGFLLFFINPTNIRFYFVFIGYIFIFI